MICGIAVTEVAKERRRSKKKTENKNKETKNNWERDQVGQSMKNK